VAHLIGNLASGPTALDLSDDIGIGHVAGRGVIPGLRHEQLPVDRRRGPVGHRVHADPIWQLPTFPNVPEYIRATALNC
jgi:hypothetical protein